VPVACPTTSINQGTHGVTNNSKNRENGLNVIQRKRPSRKVKTMAVVPSDRWASKKQLVRVGALIVSAEISTWKRTSNVDGKGKAKTTPSIRI